jgi:DNA-directed RNA polymerase
VEYNTMNDLKQEQIRIEELMSAEGQVSYWRKEERGDYHLPPIRALMRTYLTPVIAAIDTFLENAGKGQAYRSASVANLMRVYPSEVLAVIAFRQLLTSSSRGEAMSTCAKEISRILLEEWTFRNAAEHESEAYKSKLRFADAVGRQNFRRTAEGFRASLRDQDLHPFTHEERMRVGVKLIEIVITETGLFECVNIKNGSRDMQRLVQGTNKLNEWLMQAHDKASLMTPMYLPMVIRPLPWTNPYDGGYITKRYSIVRTKSRQYLEELENTEIPLIYQSINHLQDTAWSINTFILDVVDKLWEIGEPIAELPYRDGQPLPEKPLDIDTNDEARKVYRREAAITWKENVKNRGKVIGVATKLWIAKQFKEYERIYFPYFMDWRGRMYPKAVFLNPQGDDLAKALLHFADGKAIGKEGWKWLAIQLANTWGEDKVAFKDRIKWTLEHSEEIMKYAMDPLENLGWTEADSPFCFLAACKEWLGYQLQGEDYVSRIPIALDGSANGLQNLSALLKDEIGGKATALVPSDRPSDIYSLVARKAEERLLMDFEDEKNGEVARILSGQIKRDITKQPTMTVPYGVTWFGIKGQLNDVLDKHVSKGTLDLGGYNACDVSGYLSKVIRESVYDIVVAARVVMGWLQEVAKVASTNNLPVWWTTPLGFPVLQEYKEEISNRAKLYYQGKPIFVTINRIGEKLDKSSQKLGIAPNFIHSLDADHAKRTILLCQAEGIDNLSMIHDSYGTLAADTGKLAYWLREAFIQQYTESNVLEGFYNEIKEQLKNSENLVDKLPELPEMGSLDLQQVRDSLYFFA